MKEKIAIVADTGCDIDEEFVSENDVRLIPFRVIVDGTADYRDRFEIKSGRIIELLEADHSLTTSLPTMEDIRKVFDSLKDDGYTHAVVLTTASELSGTWSAVSLVAKGYEGLGTAVIDSETISMALGFLVMKAVGMVKNGLSFGNIVEMLGDIKKKAGLTIYVDTLKYLQKSGRISELKAALGEFLRIKPLLGLKEGRFFIDSLNLSKKRTLKSLRNKAMEVSENESIAVGYTGSPAEATDFAKEIGEKLGRKIRVFHIGPALTLHAGPGLIGILTL